MKIYLVGGAVRDNLLGIPHRERDWVVVGATPEDMLAKGYRQVGKDFPVFLHPETGEEYALARTERKTGKGYTGFTCYAAPDVTLEDDLKRRDLTINAIAQDHDETLIDPYGGQQDLKDKVLRHISSAFTEDPLRILRVARFAARFFDRQFTIAEETKILMRKMIRENELQYLSPERIWLEFSKALETNNPQVFLQVLRDCGALAVLFPEIDQLFGVPQRPEIHPEIDVGVHILLALKQAAQLSQSSLIVFGTLMHDLGKGITPQTLWPNHPDHGPQGVALVKKFCERYPVPKDFRELGILAAQYHTACHKCDTATAEELLEILEGLDAFRRPHRLEQVLLVCEADGSGRIGYEEKRYPLQKEILHKALQATQSVNVAEIIDKGLQGIEIREEIKKQRLQLIQESLFNKSRH